MLQSENEPGQSQLLVTAPLVLAYLILDDLCVDASESFAVVSV